MKQRVMLPGVVTQLICVLLAMMLMMCVLLTGVTAGLHLFTGVPGLHESVAATAEVQAAQAEQINRKVGELSAKHGFAADTAMALITAEEVADYNRRAVTWWQGLLAESPTLTAPAWPTEELEAAILADAGFCAANEEQKQAANARKAAADVAAAVQETILPIRANLISFAFSKVLGKIDVAKYMAFVPYLPVITGLLAALTAAVIMLLCARQSARGWAYVGSGLCAGGFAMICLMAAVAMIGLPDMVGGMSALLGMQVGLAMRQVGLILGVGAGVCAVTGLMMIGAHQKRMLSIRRRLAAMEVQG